MYPYGKTRDLLAFAGVVTCIIRNVWQGLPEQRETGSVFFVIKLVFHGFLLERVKHRSEN